MNHGNLKDTILKKKRIFINTSFQEWFKKSMYDKESSERAIQINFGQRPKILKPIIEKSSERAR
jgi:hypothetical protein